MPKRLTLLLLVFLLVPSSGAEPPRTGPETERRFPPLQVPPGFKATLFACDPLIEYPSAMARGPRPGAIFVAIDYMTGLGTEIIRRDEIRLVTDTDGDGYADKATVYADGFNSIQGMTFHDGTVYAMHAPFLTAMKDTNGDGKADQRRDLLTGLGLPPEQNPVRLHCANGVVMGHDGWLYLALGDNGCKVPRPEGDRLVLEGGGILRCRPDGRDLHVFATGLRNIYDVALDDELNVFVRDNENDGGDYKIRVCHSFFGADHGYPYLYYERPDEALPPLADLGLGSSAGGLCYLEPAFPAEYRDNLFFCEWGRAVMRYCPERAGSAFAPLKEIEFAAGAANDPYGFKPTDLAVQRDGSLMVADWGDGQRPKRGRGRIYRIAPSAQARPLGGQGGEQKDRSLAEWIGQLDSASYYARCEAQAAIERQGPDAIPALWEAMKQRLGVRGRLHAVWIHAHVGGQASVQRLIDVARSDPDPRVQAQAVKAVADLTDPVLTQHRLDAGPGDAKVAEQLAALAPARDPRVLLEVIVALGRLQWPEAPAWLQKNLDKPDAALSHAAMQTLRRSRNWPAVLKLLDAPDKEPIRTIALRAVAGRAEPVIVDGLIERLRAEPDAGRRRQYADALTRVYKKPGPWTYWGYRPPPRPPNTVQWERTDVITQALDRMLTDPDRTVRLDVLRRMQREKIPTRLPALSQWLRDEHEPARMTVILESLREHPARDTRELLMTLAAGKGYDQANRLTALAMFGGGLDAAGEQRLVELANSLEDGPVLAAALRQLSKRPKLSSAALLLKKTGSPDARVRAAAIEVLAELRVTEAGEPVPRLLKDNDAGVRQAAATAAGKLGLQAAAGLLLESARDVDAGVRRASFDTLRLLKEPRVIPLAVAALRDSDTQVAALKCLDALGSADQSRAVAELARRNPSADILPLAVRILTKWGQQEPSKGPELDRFIAELQGTSGALIRWRVTGFMHADAASALVKQWASSSERPAPLPGDHAWYDVFATGPEARLQLNADKPSGASVWVAYADVQMEEPAAVQFLAASTGSLRVWSNGRLVHQHQDLRAFQPDADRFDALLLKGTNRLLVEIGSAKGKAEFHLRFRRKSSSAEHERLTQAALTRSGNVERGRKLFHDTARSQCLKCHRLGDQGERIGPELTEIGGRFSRIHLIESILEPNRTIAPSFETEIVELKEGRLVTGTRVVETPDSLTLGDNQGQKHVLAKSAIEARRTLPQSTMPDGLEKPFTADEFVDLIAFLVAQR